jgi:hypothetical protein
MTCKVTHSHSLINYFLILHVSTTARVLARDAHIRESWVRAMETRLVRAELEKCQKTEGVNHYQNCKWLSEKYLVMLRDNKVRSILPSSMPQRRVYTSRLLVLGEGVQTCRSCIAALVVHILVDVPHRIKTYPCTTQAEHNGNASQQCCTVLRNIDRSISYHVLIVNGTLSCMLSISLLDFTDRHILC